jgi:2-polyprenyl-6-methoxyphenol hydroxylase-like FAD-dependent oxidoreductase
MRTAIVVGAGIGGLAVAGGLARSGWQVTLLAREDRLRPGKAAVVLWPNGVKALQALELVRGFDGIATPAPAMGIRRPNGQWLAQPATEGAVAPVVVHAEDLHDGFIAGLGEQVDIRTGVDIRSARPVHERPGVSDGRATYEADLVVVADGAQSALRKRLAPGSTFVSSGFAAWQAVIPWYRLPQLPPESPIGGDTLGAGHRFVSLSLGEGRSSRGGMYWVATAPGAVRPEPAEVQLALLRRWFAGWHAPIGQLLAATEPEDLLHVPVGELHPLPENLAPNGYALLGDAAHAMPHHLAQGACLALEDAATLGVLLKDAIPGKTLGAALIEYSRTRRLRALRVQALSRRASSVLQPRGGLTARAKERLAPRTLARSLEVASDWDPPRF